jgi:ABC-2 type transport system ATP-binding protein
MLPNMLEMNGTVVEATSLGKTYGAGFRGRAVHALADFSLSVEAGEVFGLLGPNGAGKTTFIKILLGIISASEGSASLLGRSVKTAAARRRVGYLPEQHRFPGHLTARQALDLYARLAGMGAPERRSEIKRLLDRVSLTEWADVRTKKFSKGMMQRLGLAQALMGRPALVVLDEPTDGVDPVGRREIREILSWLREQGTTVFLNSHLLSEVEMICSRVAVLDKGKLVREGTIRDLTAGPTGYEIVGSRTDLPLPDGVERSEDGAWPTYRIQASSPDELTVHLRKMIDLGIAVREVTPMRRSLEQAFMDLVGEGTS